MTFAPFVDWGKFLPNPTGQLKERQKVELPDGSQANVKDFSCKSFRGYNLSKNEPNPVLDEEAFRVWQFIRLPEELGGHNE